MSITSLIRNVGVVRIAVLASTLAALSGTCVAQQSQDQAQELTGSFSRPLGSTHNSTQVTSRTMIAEADGDDSYTLIMNGDSVKVEHNGKKVPENRVVVKDGLVQVLDKDGAVEHEFHLHTTPAVPAIPPGAAAGGSRSAHSPRATANIAVTSSPPPVMVGMLMEFDEDQEGLVVQRVFDGLPAAKGGLEAADVIVEIEGKKVENNESLREALRSKKPGDKLTIVVDRDGEKKNLSLELIKFDQESLDKARGEEAVTVEGFDLGQHGLTWNTVPGMGALGDPAFRDTIRKSVERALETVKANSAAEADKWKDDVIKSLEEALKSVEKSSVQLRGQMNTLRGHGTGNGQTMIFREMPNQVFEVPGVPMTPSAAASQEHLEKLTKALDRLNKRLDDIEKKLDEKK